MLKPNLSEFLREIEYFIDFKPRTRRPGKWQSADITGSGFSFKKFGFLSDYPDFRRIDLLATARNFLRQEPSVRILEQTAAIEVVMLADLSLSAAFNFLEPKTWQIAKLATLFGYTAYRYGDHFSFIGCDEAIIEKLFFPPARSKIYGLEIGEELLDFRPFVSSAEGLLEADTFLPSRKSKIIFVSDFYFETDFLEKVLGVLKKHEILPIILRQAVERKWPKGLKGLVSFRDMEKGVEKRLFLRKEIVEKFNRISQRNEELLKSVLSPRQPVVLEKVTIENILEEI